MSGQVYSYLRFSDPRQATGSSADRQLAYAAVWVAKRGMPLDATLTLKDEGLSAYHQRHVKQGALGVFLRAIEDGRIGNGSVLVVEGLDRLSRAEPIQAQAQLAQIINAGITVVTASDGREYNRAGLKAQPMDLVYSLLVMIRAHEESDTKSKRVKAAIRRQCEGWMSGTYRGLVRNGKDPQWLQLTSEALYHADSAARLEPAPGAEGRPGVAAQRSMPTARRCRWQLAAPNGRQDPGQGDRTRSGGDAEHGELPEPHQDGGQPFNRVGGWDQENRGAGRAQAAVGWICESGGRRRPAPSHWPRPEPSGGAEAQRHGGRRYGGKDPGVA